MSSSFYRAFEDRYRGSRELILERLKVYLPFIEKLKELHNPCAALDLGCGRGEWLQLLQNNGVEARGVDLDAGMLQACIELGLQVEQRDAIETLKSLPDNSLSVVSGFHIVEHIEFSQVQLLVEQALRVLRPGGLIILETPNAENLVVGSHNFYLDPTHIRPVPHILLAFVTELAGFVRNKTLRLQEDPQTHRLERPNLLHVLVGVSPDYAIVAQKPSNTEEMSGFDALFENEYGISLNHITEHYDQALNAELQGIKHRMEELAQQEETLRTALTTTAERAEQTAHKNETLTLELHKLELRAVQLETQKEQQLQQMLQSMQRAHQEEMRARQAESQLHEVSTSAARFEALYDVSQNNTNSLTKQLEEITSELLSLNRTRQELEYQLNSSTQQLNESLSNAHDWYLRATAAEQRVNDLLRSSSWRITAPLRGIRNLIVWLLCLPFRLIKSCLRPVLSVSIRYAVNRRTLRLRWSNRLKAHPRLFAHLRQFAIHHGLIDPPAHASTPVVAPVTLMPKEQNNFKVENTVHGAVEVDLTGLTPRARQIYIDLQAAINRQKQGGN